MVAECLFHKTGMIWLVEGAALKILVMVHLFDGKATPNFYLSH